MLSRGGYIMNRFTRIALLTSASLFGIATNAFAQNAEPAPKKVMEEVVVTGSRIVRDGYKAPTPVTVASAVEMAKSTPSSIPEGLVKLPQFSNSLGGGRAASNFSNIPIHGNVLNLRGLGTTGANPKGPLRTLILFDGIRMAPTEYIGTIDTNVIPQLLIKRVDIVTGGASAAWGSDAVAGVVNFVLDTKFTGVSGVAQAGSSTKADNVNQRFGLAGGWKFAGDKGHLLLSGEYFSNDGMLRSDRDYANKGYTYVGITPNCVAPASNPTGCTQGGSLNPYGIFPNVKIASIYPNGRITGSSVTGNPFVGQVINNDGTTRPFVNGGAVGSAAFQVGGDGYEIPQNTHAVTPVKNYQSFGRVSYDFTDNTKAYAQVIFSRTDMNYITQQNALIGPSGAVNIYSGNPYLSAALAASIPTAGSFITVQQTQAGQPQPTAEERTDYWQATAGLQGEFSNWNWNIDFTHGESKHTTDNHGLYDYKKLYAAVDAVIDPNTLKATCRVLLDPTVASQYTGCTPLDVLHGNPAASTPAGYAYATGTSSYLASIKQDSFTARMSGSLFELPAGSVDLTVGGEYRKQSLELTSNADPATLAGTSTNAATLATQTAAIRSAYFAGLRGVPSGALYYWLSNVGSASGDYDVKEAFAEVAVPLIKDAPFIKDLSLNGAVRATEYSTSGGVKTWKIGGIWSTGDQLLFRTTYSSDIRAPNLFEIYSGPQSGIGIVNDTCGGNTAVCSGLSLNVASVVSGNINLKPEEAKTLTVGAVFRPKFLPGFSASVDYYSIDLENAIDQLSAQQIITNCNNNGSSDPSCAFITRPAAVGGLAQFPTVISIAPANIAFLKTAGVDLDASYRTQLNGGQLGLRLYANYLDKFDTQLFKGAPTLHFAGVSVVTSNPAAYPKWRGSLSVDYNKGIYGVTLTQSLIGKMRLDIPGNLPNGAKLNFVVPDVEAVHYTDLTLRADLPFEKTKSEIFVTVNNLFDKQPPIIPGTVPGVNIPTNISVYDIVGRAITAGVRFRF